MVWPNAHGRPSVTAQQYLVLKRPVVIPANASRHALRVAYKRNATTERHRRLWDLATACLRSVDRTYADTFTDMAVTKNFVGSPHVDKYDLCPQYALSLGGYGEPGGAQGKRGQGGGRGQGKQGEGNGTVGAPMGGVGGGDGDGDGDGDGTGDGDEHGGGAVGGGGGRGGELCVEAGPLDVVCIDTFRRVAKMDGRFVHWVTAYKGERYSVIYYRTEGAVVPKTRAVFSPEDLE
jgi:hypothetical protein